MTACRLLLILPSSRAARAVMAMFLLLRVDTSGSSSMRGEDEGHATSGIYGQEDEGGLMSGVSTRGGGGRRLLSLIHI